MRKTRLTLVVALLSVCAVAMAQEVPAAALEQRAWLGVSVTPPPPALRHQLSVPEGIGLVVEFVMPKAPAEQSGLRPYDLLIKLDDQWLVNPEQLAVLVRMHHSGDQVKVTYLREGKEATTTARLVDHEVPRLHEGEDWPGPDFPPLPGRNVPGLPKLEFAPKTSIMRFDGNKQISIDYSDGHASLIVSDPRTGRIILQSQIDTQQQRDALPPDVRDLVKNMLGYDSQKGNKVEGNPATKPSE